MAIENINIETKQNHPIAEVQEQQYGSQYFLKASELNAIISKIQELIAFLNTSPEYALELVDNELALFKGSDKIDVVYFTDLLAKQWNKAGNNNVVTTDFIGSINNEDVVFKTNNIERFRIKKTGELLLPSTNNKFGTSIDFINFNASNITTEHVHNGSVILNLNKGSYGGRTFRIQNNGVDVFLLPINIGNTGNSPRFPFLNNANGDATFTKQVVAKTDGTFGVRDMANETWSSLTSFVQTDLNGALVNDAISGTRMKGNTVCLSLEFSSTNAISQTAIAVIATAHRPQIPVTLTAFTNNGVPFQIRVNTSGWVEITHFPANGYAVADVQFSI